MPVPSSINDLSTTAGSNSPAGSESPALIDDYLRAHAGFIAELREKSESIATTDNLAATDSGKGASMVGYLPAGAGAVSTTVHERLREHDTRLAIVPDSQVYDVVAKTTSFLSQEITDNRGDTFPNFFRRILEYRRPIGGGDVFEVVSEKSINTTAAGYCLRYFSGCAEQYTSLASEYAAIIRRLASLLMSVQHVDDRCARFGGFALAPKDGTASAYNAGMCGLGLLGAYRVTLDPSYLESAKRAAVFLGVLNNPNPRYSALYGVTPIPALPENASWSGFCDQISPSDTITTTHSVWNLIASQFLCELYELTGDPSYQTLYQSTRDWGAAGVTGFYDYWSVRHDGALPSKVSNNWFASGLVVSDGAWHRRGESVISGGAVRSGAITSATATSVTLDAGASTVDGFYTGMAIRMTSGASSGTGSVITAYNGTTKVASLRYGFPTMPTTGDSYQIGLTANTIGSDQMEYGIEALYKTGYSVSAIRTAYETIASWPNADSGAFGAAYDSRICWTGYFRPMAGVYGGQSKAYGTHYDVQGIGPLLKFKKQQYPDHWALSFEKALLIPEMATLVDKDFNTIWSTDSTGLFEYSTVGTGTVKGTVTLGILESFNA